MGIESAVMLERVAAILRRDVGPAVGDEFARTQAFMASVIIAKLAVELGNAESGAAAAGAAHVVVATELRAAVAAPPPRLAAAIDALAVDGATAAWSEVVAALHAARPELAPEQFDAALPIVRRALRARLDDALRAAR